MQAGTSACTSGLDAEQEEDRHAGMGIPLASRGTNSKVWHASGWRACDGTHACALPCAPWKAHHTVDSIDIALRGSASGFIGMRRPDASCRTRGEPIA